jgi:hypothetical protein
MVPVETAAVPAPVETAVLAKEGADMPFDAVADMGN